MMFLDIVENKKAFPEASRKGFFGLVNQKYYLLKTNLFSPSGIGMVQQQQQQQQHACNCT
jgi:hypothetical protein